MNRPVIFLDIDGVLCWGKPRSAPEIPGLARDLSQKLGNPVIATLSDQLCSQIQSHFDQKACQAIETLCQESGAEIVISSSWRLFHSLEQMQAIFQIAGIHHVTGMLPNGSVRRDVISAYIAGHQISSYIVVDDMNLTKVFGYRFIQCTQGFGQSQFALARSAFRIQTPRTPKPQNRCAAA